MGWGALGDVAGGLADGLGRGAAIGMSLRDAQHRHQDRQRLAKKALDDNKAQMAELAWEEQRRQALTDVADNYRMAGEGYMSDILRTADTDQGFDYLGKFGAPTTGEQFALGGDVVQSGAYEPAEIEGLLKTLGEGVAHPRYGQAGRIEFEKDVFNPGRHLPMETRPPPSDALMRGVGQGAGPGAGQAAVGPPMTGLGIPPMPQGITGGALGTPMGGTGGPPTVDTRHPGVTTPALPTLSGGQPAGPMAAERGALIAEAENAHEMRTSQQALENLLSLVGGDTSRAHVLMNEFIREGVDPEELPLLLQYIQGNQIGAPENPSGIPPALGGPTVMEGSTRGIPDILMRSPHVGGTFPPVDAPTLMEGRVQHPASDIPADTRPMVGGRPTTPPLGEIPLSGDPFEAAGAGLPADYGFHQYMPSAQDASANRSQAESDSLPQGFTRGDSIRAGLAAGTPADSLRLGMIQPERKTWGRRPKHW